MYNVGSLLHYQIDSFISQEELREVKCQKGDLFLVIRADKHHAYLVHQNTLYSSYWVVRTLDRYFKAVI
jgi:hypothetical protein